MQIPGKTLFIGGAILTLGIGSGVAVASIPSSTGTISACYGKVGGVVRVIDAPGQKCTKLETPLTWNQTGVQGAPGQAGTPGTPGTPGAAGQDGKDGQSGAALTASSLYVAAGQGSLVDEGRYVAESKCNSGDEVIGANSSYTSGNVTSTELTRAAVSIGGLGRGMRLIVHGSDSNIYAEVTALCLDSTP